MLLTGTRGGIQRQWRGHAEHRLRHAGQQHQAQLCGIDAMQQLLHAVAHGQSAAVVIEGDGVVHALRGVAAAVGMPDRIAGRSRRTWPAVAHGDAQVLALRAQSVVQAHVELGSPSHGLGDRVVLQVQADVRGDLVEQREVDGDRVVVGDGELECKGVFSQQRTRDFAVHAKHQLCTPFSCYEPIQLRDRDSETRSNAGRLVSPANIDVRSPKRPDYRCPIVGRAGLPGHGAASATDCPDFLSQA